MSKIIDLKEEKKKQKRKNIIMKIIFAVATIYIFYAIFLILKVPTDTITVETGILTEEETATGIIIRDEVVAKGNNYTNGIETILNEGEKAAKNQIVFRYYGKNESELQEKIEEVNKKIQNAIGKEERSILSSDIKKLENQLDNKLKNLNKQTDIQSISEYKKSISDIMLKKALILGETGKNSSSLKKLISEKEKIENDLDKETEYIKAPISGIISYRVDGLEEVLGANNFDDMKIGDLENLDLKTGKIISTNNECGKVVDNFGCYIATILDSERARNAKVGDKIKITTQGGDEIDSSIYHINDEQDKRLIILKINTLTEELLSYRKISLNITWWSYSGIKVPNKAIIEEKDGLKYIIKKTNKGTEKVLIKVLKKNELYSIIGAYSSDDLKELGIDSTKYKGINTYDTIMLYPSAYDSKTEK